ncbi:MAG: prolyl oligopeptidase family serine peptidase [Gemmatimonadota bacterium]
MRHTTQWMVFVLAALASIAAPALAQQVDDPPDPYLWLEEVEGERAMRWVQEQSRGTLDALSRHPAYQRLYRDALEILSSDERIAYPSIMGDHLYNFWTDDTHERGIWRRTSWESYLSGEPEWEVVLDIDALAILEGETWAFGGATCLAPEYRHCMVSLSRGGADATEVREFDLETATFVEDGFFLPEAKNSVAWKSRDELLVSTDFGEGSLTASGYPRVAKLWRRGQPLSRAETLFEGEREDVGVWVGALETATDRYQVVFHRPSFFEGTVHVLQDGDLVALDAPPDADPMIVSDQLVVYLRSPWEVGGATYPQGAVVAMEYDRFLAGDRDFDMVVEPTATQTVQGVADTRDYLLVSLLDNVRGELWRYHREGGEWVGEAIDAPAMGTIGVASTDVHTNRFFFTFSSYSQPTTLYLADHDGSVREVRQLPAMFDADGLQVEQHHATSRDGTRIPFFLVHDEDMRRDGGNPTLLYGYGGFEVSQTPSYSGIVGKAWLEQGGAYVVANIRGGGEFGPAWHRAALKENRQRAYDDFIAVAEYLIDHGITSPDHLGIMGGSNGGLLVGVAMTQRPDLFDAVVVQVPLLDMRRYNKLLAGASWMAEYGNPDVPEEWAYIREYSPYQNVEPDESYPRPLFYTTTRDDRVHPGHARKMAAKMADMGHPVYYYENTEGGHGAGITPEQRARMYALTYAYLLERLQE